jgi:SpoVK/Ycf46/Vps4 family AAA+-type ATPase
MSKEKGPLILFFDELDAIASERSNDQEVGEIKRLVITFLQRIDDMVISAPGVVLIGATNHAESLDRAVWRRFSFHIKFDLPPKEAKFELIDRMLDDLEFNASLKMELGIRNYKNREDVTDIIENYTGADIQRAFQVIYLDALKEIQINPGYEIGKLKMIEIISLVGGTSRIQDEIKLNNKNTTNEQNRSEIQRKFKLNKQ